MFWFKTIKNLKEDIKRIEGRCDRLYEENEALRKDLLIANKALDDYKEKVDRLFKYAKDEPTFEIVTNRIKTCRWSLSTRYKILIYKNYDEYNFDLVGLSTYGYANTEDWDITFKVENNRVYVTIDMSPEKTVSSIYEYVFDLEHGSTVYSIDFKEKHNENN